MMAVSESVDLQAQLLTVKHAVDAGTLFPQHAFARGGVGHFLCTGHSRAGLNRLPQAASQAAALSLTARGRLNSPRGNPTAHGGGSEADSSIGGSGFSLISTDPLSIGATPAWEAGTAQHATNFVAACRTIRPTDIRAGSKWASMSYFENSPREVARHMAKMDHLQAVSDAIKAAERQTEQARHNIWAEQQRGTFRRQRLEQAARYTRSGIRPRSAYADLGALDAAEAVHGGGAAAAEQEEAAAAASGAGSGSGSGAGGGIPFPFPDPAQRFFAAAPVRGALGASRSDGGQQQYGSYGSYGLYGSRPSTALPGGAAANEAQQRLLASGLAGGSGRGGSGGGGGGAAAVVVPLPKPSYGRVYDRMAAEAADTPATRAAAVAAARAAVEEERRRAVLAGELQELDTFEGRMRSLQRTRSRAARVEGRRGSGAHMEDDDS